MSSRLTLSRWDEMNNCDQFVMNLSFSGHGFTSVKHDCSVKSQIPMNVPFIRNQQISLALTLLTRKRHFSL